MNEIDELDWNEVYLKDLKMFEDNGYYIEIDGDRKKIKLFMLFEVIQ